VGIDGADLLREFRGGSYGIEPVVEESKAQSMASRNLSAGEADEKGKGFISSLLHEEPVDLKVHRVIVNDQNFGMTRLHVDPPPE